MHIKNKKGQVTVEYILLVTAVIAVMIVFATNKNGGLQGQLNSTLTNVVNEWNGVSDSLSQSHQPTSAPTGGGTPPITIDVTNGLGN